jgi:hypothetical protein
MPCTFTGTLEGDAALRAREELDRQTDRLCRMCRRIEALGHDLTTIDPDVAEWWAKHKKEDIARGQTQKRRHRPRPPNTKKKTSPAAARRLRERNKEEKC